MEKWPNFFIVGAPKAGTTTLYEFLKKTPGVYMSKHKEPQYFCPNIPLFDGSTKRYASKEKYLKLFEGVKNEIAIGEASTKYLQDPDSPKLIKKIVPDSKIIISLRDPVERAYSSYLMRVSRGFETLPFNEAIMIDISKPLEDFGRYNVLKAGFYSDSVSRYLEIFGRDRVKILIFEEFIQDVKKSTMDVLSFLGINNKSISISKEQYNPYVTPRGKLSLLVLKNKFIRKGASYLVSPDVAKTVRRKFLNKESQKPKLPNESRNYLKELYREDVKKTTKILGRKHPWPNFQNI